MDQFRPVVRVQGGLYFAGDQTDTIALLRARNVEYVWDNELLGVQGAIDRLRQNTLPVITAAQNDYGLVVRAGAWVVDKCVLPFVTNADNGCIMRVKDGKWTKVPLFAAEEAGGIF